MARILIVGGGITGLSAAYYLSRSGEHRVTLIESSATLGGKVRTERIGGLLVELGPDSVFTRKTAALELVHELGLEDEIIEPQQGEFAILHKGRLQGVPRTLAALMPSANANLEKVGLFSATGRERITAEKDVPKGSGEDESIASFFRRRFGDEFSQLLAEPILAGVHAGDPEKLSMEALYPGYVGLEQKHGRLTVEALPGQDSVHRPAFVSLRRGMGSLADALVEKLSGVRILTGRGVDSLAFDGSFVTAVFGDERLVADHLILAVPAAAASRLLETASPDSASLLSQVRYASTAVVTLAYEASAFPEGIHGNGFLVPYTESCDITGCTFSSNKWPGRAPEGTVLLRAFLGRDARVNVDELTDDELISKAKGAIRKILEARQTPTFCRIDRWSDGMPQYDLGHVDLMEEVRRRLEHLPVSLAGSSYQGNSVPDCIRQGREVAESLSVPVATESSLSL